MTQTRDLLFVSPRFLFPIDSGGKIRTTQVLRGMKGGGFRIVLMSPATDALVKQYRAELDQVCDEFRWWPEPRRGRLYKYTRMRYLFGRLPISVYADRHAAGVTAVADALAQSPAAAVFDFAHAAVLAPPALDCPSVMFTHNVEAEIFRRHRDVATNPVFRAIWGNQYRKMRNFEKQMVMQFDVVVAVAERDARQFVDDYRISEPSVIPTGVDLDFFSYQAPQRALEVVFLGAMDWMANQDGVTFFMDEVWDKVVANVSDAKMIVVGRAPPESLVQEAMRRKLNWSFTGFVDDVRPYVQGAAVSVIPLRVGGGTRLKAYEAMAMGSPVVSTAIGVEGLPVQAGQHCLVADNAADFAAAVVSLLKDSARRDQLSREARVFVEENASYTVAARAFEEACTLAVERARQRGQNNF